MADTVTISSHSRTVIFAIVGSVAIITAITGCPRSSGRLTGPGPDPVVDAGVDGDGAVVADAVEAADQSDEPGGLLPAAGVSCAAIPCIYYPGTDTHHQCLSAGAGRCFHYGPECAPMGGCMYDSSTGAYRQCAQPRRGKCASFAAACQPADRCMYDRSDGLFRACEQVAEGKCSRFGPTCNPV